MKSIQKGFTLIELMIVIAILGILMAIAIPAYQDYTVRAKVSECVNQLAPIKTGYSEYVISNGRFPSLMTSVATPAATQYCKAAEKGSANNIISITSSIAGITNVTLLLTANTNSAGNVNWTCTTLDANGAKYAPSSCR
jgi:type IV pilus assembly protein PilA